MKSSSLNLLVEIDDDRWASLKSDSLWHDFFLKCVHLVLKRFLLDDISWELSFVLTNDSSIEAINRDHRQKDKPTNVLSFPQFDNAVNEKESILRMYDGLFKADEHFFLPLGDIVLSFETIQKESLEQSKTMMDHVCHLVIHSVLHLLGFDHQTEDQASVMEKFEIDFLETLGIKNPYEVESSL